MARRAALPVRRAAALILRRAGYSSEQVTELLREPLEPLNTAHLTHELLDQARAVVLRKFTYYGVDDAAAALHAALPSRIVCAPPDPGGEQLLIDLP